jgi:pimeloyl-ACP methyl ester carboxylesterase
LSEVYSKFDPANTILAGFSYGSLIAFMVATKRNPTELWLFSFSPYFAEDIPLLKKSWLTRLGHRRVDAFRLMNFSSLAKKIHCKTLVFIGDLEAKKYPDLERRAIIASQTLANDHLIYVEKCGHDVSNNNYVKAIVRNI